MATKYKVYERPRSKKKLPKMKPEGEYPPKYKVYKRPRPRRRKPIEAE